jgi:hypothetical protein
MIILVHIIPAAPLLTLKQKSLHHSEAMRA